MSPTAQLGELADVPVTLEAEVARRNCRLDELLSLAPGTVLRFPNSYPAGAVQLFAGRILLGVGEICQSKGRSAVRIVSTEPEGTGYAAG